MLARCKRISNKITASEDSKPMAAATEGLKPKGWKWKPAAVQAEAKTMRTRK
jgi:hypothetical protein